MTIADIGENFVAAWASQAGFTINPVRRDRHGWDHIVEFSAPSQSNDSGPLGLGTTISARIQVKTTRASRRYIAVKLSNWRRALEDILPWFFVIVRLQRESHEPIEVALIHLNEELTEKVFRRIYQLPEEERSLLHQQYMSLRWGTNDLLEQPIHTSLPKAVRDAVGDDPHRYALEKRRWLDEAGTQEGSVRATFKVQAKTEDELHRRLAFAAVGLDESLEVASFSILRQRFGVEESIGPRNQAATLTIGRPEKAQQVTLIISGEDGDGAATLTAPMRFSAAVFPKLPEEFWMLRFQTRLLDLVLNIGRGSFDIRFTMPAAGSAVPLREVVRVFPFVRMLLETSRRPLGFHLRRGAETSTLGTLSSASEPKPEFLNLVRIAGALADLAQDLNADLDVEISLREVYELGKVAEFIRAARAHRPTAVRINFSVPSGTSVEEGIATVFADPAIRIGGIIYTEIVRLTGVLAIVSSNEDEILLQIESQEISSVRTYSLSEEQSRHCNWERLLDEISDGNIADVSENVFLAPLGLNYK